MYQQGDWVTIKYGEYAGQYGKITAINKNGFYRVLPYQKNAEPGSMLVLDDSGLDLIEPVMVNSKELRGLARAEVMYRDIADQVFPIFNIRAQQSYKLLPADIAQALQNINQFPDCLGRFREWFWLIQNIFYDDLEIAGRYDSECFSDAPTSSDQLFSTVYYLTETLYWKLEERYVTKEEAEKYIVRFAQEDDPWENSLSQNTKLEEAAYKAVCEDIVSRVRTFEFNLSRPRKDWIYCPSQKRHIINSYEDETELMQAPAREKALYRRCVMDLYRQGDVQAMKILAWGYLEGDSIFRQSMRQAQKYLRALFEKSGDPFAANALGVISYHGLAGKQEPDYGKAYSYFSYGALAGIDESLFSLGNMLIHGQGTVKNVDMGMNLIVDGYKDTLQRFSEGEYDNRFADYAYYMGMICRENIILGMGLRDACKFFMEADFAIARRMSVNKLFRDEQLADDIRKELADARAAFGVDEKKTILRADFPIYISHMFEDRMPIRVTICKRQADYYLKMSRFRLLPGEESQVLVAFPELSYVNLVKELEFKLEEPGAIKIPETGETFLAEGFMKNEHTGVLEFYFGGECIAAAEAKWFVVDVTKEKMMLKMNAKKENRRYE